MKIMLSKALVLAVIVLFIGASVVPSISSDEPVSRGTIYVDDDFNASTPGWNVTNFSKIQDGIDAVAANGTVYVFNGIYLEVKK